MADPIQGTLPWSSGAASMDFSGNPAGLANSYASAYNSSLGMNQQNYNNILQGYQQTQAQQQAAQQGVQQGYGNLSGAVLGGIQGIGASRSQDIASDYARQSGAAAQSLISRGLGNTTIQDSVQRGLAFDKSRADTTLANQMAGLQAGYQSQLGLAGLGYAGQAAAQNTDQANRQLGWMNSVNAGYPDASLYARLAQMYGAGQVGAADRQQQQDALQRLQLGSAPGAGVQRGTTSYSPGGTGGATGRPSAGLFAGGGAYGSSLGGSGTPLAMAGNYFGTGTPQSVYGGGGGGLASAIGLGQQQAQGYLQGGIDAAMGGADASLAADPTGYGDYLSGGAGGYYGYPAGAAADPYAGYLDYYGE
jgi:hypothetical protein